jgi:uncharacterized protein (UPF0335 family)
MRKQIFEEMKRMGWNLENFREVLDIHKSVMEYKLDEHEEKGIENGQTNLYQFLCDFIQAIENIEKRKIGQKNDGKHTFVEVIDTIKLSRDGSEYEQPVLKSMHGFALGECDELTPVTDWYNTVEEVYINFFKMEKERYEDKWEQNNKDND